MYYFNKRTTSNGIFKAQVEDISLITAVQNMSYVNKLYAL